jgi:sulfatase modifying factor 1
MQTITRIENIPSPPGHEGMKLIPAGSFLMGAEGWGEFESPVHEVYLDDFMIDETHVTNKSFADFVAETGYKTTAEQNGFAKGYQGGIITNISGLCWKIYFTETRADHPVVLISWEDANAFAIWAGKRLPTEAEFEKASRGGLIQQHYPWGDKEPEISICNFARHTIDIPSTTSVKTFPPNGYNLYDMAGNVWHWCADWFAENAYLQSEKENPKGSPTGITKARRGASFNIIQPFRLRCSNRGAYLPSNYAINIGFRCVKTIQS